MQKRIYYYDWNCPALALSYCQACGVDAESPAQPLGQRRNRGKSMNLVGGSYDKISIDRYRDTCL